MYQFRLLIKWTVNQTSVNGISLRCVFQVAQIIIGKESATQIVILGTIGIGYSHTSAICQCQHSSRRLVEAKIKCTTNHIETEWLIELSYLNGTILIGIGGKSIFDGYFVSGISHFQFHSPVLIGSFHTDAKVIKFRAVAKVIRILQIHSSIH